MLAAMRKLTRARSFIGRWSSKFWRMVLLFHDDDHWKAECADVAAIVTHLPSGSSTTT